jgi:hypothetical protein
MALIGCVGVSADIPIARIVDSTKEMIISQTMIKITLLLLNIKNPPPCLIYVQAYV